MKEPELIAELSAEATHDGKSTAAAIAEARAAGKIIQGDLLTWTWGPGGVGRLYRGEAPPRVGDIVQLAADHHWPRCLCVVTEPRSWGVVAELRTPGGDAPIRLGWSDFEVVGQVRE